MLTRPTERFDEAPADRPVERLDLAVDFAPTPIEVTSEGWKVYRGTAAFGDVVLDYTQEFGTRELVPAEEAFSPRALDTLIGRPFTLGHPPRCLTPETTRGWIRGTVKAAVRSDEGGTPRLVVDVLVMDAEADTAISSGLVRELSLGRRVKKDKRPGTFKGERYDVRQYDFNYNHLAGVPKGRSRTKDGESARFDEDKSMDEIEITLPDGTKTMVAKAVAEHLAKLQAELKAAAGATPTDGAPPPPPPPAGDAKPDEDERLDAASINALIDAKLKPISERLDALPGVIRGEISGYAQVRAVAEPILAEAKVEHRFDGDAFGAKAEVCKVVFGKDDEDVLAAEKETDVPRMDGLFKAAVREHKRRGDTTAGQLAGLVSPKKGESGESGERHDASGEAPADKMKSIAPGFFK